MIGTLNFDRVDTALNLGDAFRVQVQKIGHEGLTFTVPQRGEYKPVTITMRCQKWQLAEAGDMLVVCVENSGIRSTTQILEITKMKDGKIIDPILCKD